MVHYVRFLQLPHGPSKNKSGHDTSISALVTITTDLGESFLAAEVHLKVSLIRNDADTVAVTEDFEWHPGDRQLRITFNHLDHLLNQELYMTVTPNSSRGDSPLDVASLGPILGVSSPAFTCNPKAITPVAHQVRKFELNNGKVLQIVEDKGDSIAMHIWDAAIGFLACLQHYDQKCGRWANRCLCCLLQGMKQPTNVLELGAGCGIVGISLAAIFPQLHVTMTDVDDAKCLMDLNVKNSHLRSVTTAELDWDKEPSLELISNIDLVFVSDCTYNSDTIPSLVNLLSKVARESPGVCVVVGMKRRHESEKVFFDLMRNHFHLWQSSKTPLQHISTEEDPSKPIFELNLYKKIQN